MAIFTFMETKECFPSASFHIRERAHDIVYKLTQDDPATFDDEWKRYALWSSWTKIEKEAQAMGDTKRESYSRMVLNMVINNDKNNNTQGS